MKPSHLRIFLAAFGFVAVGVAANVLLLQRGPQATAMGKVQAERSAQRAAAERARRLAVDQPPSVEKPIDFDRVSSPPPPVPVLGRAEPIPSNPPMPVAAASPPPRATVAAMLDPPIRFARFKPDAARVEALPEAPDAEGDFETIRAVQRELIQRGYGPIQADGIPGLVTRAAIMAYEHDNKLPLTGEATANLLKGLLLGAAPSGEARAEAGRVRSAQAEHVMRTVQQSLSVVGYQPGRVDGRVGEETERAIREFEMDEGIVPSGRVSAELVTRLARAASSGKMSAKR